MYYSIHLSLTEPAQQRRIIFRQRRIYKNLSLEEKEMKKAFALLLSLCMAAGLLAGCGDSGTTSADNSSAGAISAAGAAKIDFPQKEIKVIVPWDAGGGNDVAARELQSVIKELYDVDIVI